MELPTIHYVSCAVSENGIGIAEKLEEVHCDILYNMTKSILPSNYSIQYNQNAYKNIGKILLKYIKQ